jgi:6-phosphogluconolactonase
MATQADLHIFEDRQALARGAAGQVVALAQKAIAARNIFCLALSGGSTPRPLHKILCRPDQVEQIDWSKVQIFWGDERCVPPDDPDSNYRMAVETLLKHVPIPADHIHRIRGELSPQQAADDYQEQIAAQFGLTPSETGQPFPRFDLILLGLGPDGHTASLFPGSEALEEKHRWVSPVPHDQGPEPLVPRVTLTLPIIQAARQIIFLVSGEDKANRLAEVLAPIMGKPLPAQLAKPSHGRLLWMVDRAAASGLEQI